MTDPLQALQETGATIITPTRRLSRELIATWDQRQLASGRSAWPSADVLPWDAWVIRSWEYLQPLAEQPELLLSDDQARALWRQIIERDIARHDGAAAQLWNHDSTAREAYRAWRMVHDWLIDPERVEQSRHADHSAFARWARQFSKRCEREHWVDSARLSGRLIAAIEQLPDQKLCLTGFDRLLPAQQALVDALGALDAISITVLESGKADFSATRLDHYPDEFSQWLAAGAWAKQRLQADPDQRIALVLPDLSRSRDLVEYALRQTLCPVDLLRPGDATERPFHLSLGQPLIDTEVGHHALQLIRLFSSRTLLVEQVGQLLRSPWLGGYSEETHQRSQMARSLCGQLKYQTSLEELERLVQSTGQCPILDRLLSSVGALLAEQPARATFRDWAGVLARLLVSAGWSASAGDRSDLYQASEAVMNQIESLGELDLVRGPVTLEQAVEQLGQRLSTQVFQPEALDTPVQILGVVEAGGLAFDAIWFGNLIDDMWPGPTRPNPFIAVPLQRDAGVTEASSDTMTALGRMQMARLAASTPVLRFSTFSHDEETAVIPSPLVRSCPVDTEPPAPPDTLASLIQQTSPQLETIEDNRGSAIAVDKAFQGGTALVRAQSRCPRNAYLQYRLHGDTPEAPLQGLDPAERGILVHRLLELVWREIGNSASLGALSDQALEQIVSDQVSEVAGSFFFRSGCGNRFFEIQRRWLTRTLLAWFAVERQRPIPFEVLAREEHATVSLSGLELQFQIDRIDRFEDGSLGLIDYKTGGSWSIGDWGQARPDEPQLPLYWLSQQNPDRQDQAVSLVAFARVRLGDCQLAGVTNSEAQVGSGKPVSIVFPENQSSLSRHVASWEDLTAGWSRDMNALGQEFRQGVAVVDPRNEGLCRSCPTPAFCRSGDCLEVSADQADDYDESEAGWNS